MPGITGRDVARAVKAEHPDTAVILLTGWAQRLIADGDLPAGVDAVVAKPPRARQLHEALARVLRVRA